MRQPSVLTEARTFSRTSTSKASSKPGTAGYHAPVAQEPPAEPSEEDVARAFAVYDLNGIGEIPTLSLEGAAFDACFLFPEYVKILL